MGDEILYDGEKLAPRCDCGAIEAPHRHQQRGPVALNDLPGPDEGEPEEAATAVTATSTPAEKVLAANAHDVIAAVADIDSVSELEGLRNAEIAGKNRSTVVIAIENRISSLEK